MDKAKFDMIREGAQARRVARSLTEAAQPQPELQSFTDADAVIAAIQKAK